MSMKPVQTSPPHTDAGGVLLSVCLAALVLPLSFSGGAVATPVIGRALGGSPIALTWITNAFMLSFGSCLMAGGSLADRFGASAFSSWAWHLSQRSRSCLVCRLRCRYSISSEPRQGIAAAAALSGGSAALAQEFEGHARTKAFSLLGTTFGVGLAFGPILAGVLIEVFGWRSVFLSAAVIGVMALIFGVRRMRESRDPDAVSLDWLGTLAFTGALSLFTFAVIQGPESGWTSRLIISLFAGAADVARRFHHRGDPQQASDARPVAVPLSPFRRRSDPAGGDLLLLRRLAGPPAVALHRGRWIRGIRRRIADGGVVGALAGGSFSCRHADAVVFPGRFCQASAS